MLLIIIAISIVFVKFFLTLHGIDIEKSKFPVTGIDISKHNGDIDWPEVKNHGIDFVFIKATEGVSYIDPHFETNYKGAKEQSIPVSAYHFYRFNRNGNDQAKIFIKNAHLKSLDLPPVVDVEEWGNPIGNNSITDIVKEIKSFIVDVEKISLKPVIIYTNESSYKKFIKNNFPNNEIWICSFVKKGPKLDRKWKFWQYSHKGTISGINGLVDMNTFNGSRKEWEEYIKP